MDAIDCESIRWPILRAVPKRAAPDGRYLDRDPEPWSLARVEITGVADYPGVRFTKPKNGHAELCPNCATSGSGPPAVIFASVRAGNEGGSAVHDARYRRCVRLF